MNTIDKNKYRYVGCIATRIACDKCKIMSETETFNKLLVLENITKFGDNVLLICKKCYNGVK